MFYLSNLNGERMGMIFLTFNGTPQIEKALPLEGSWLPPCSILIHWLSDDLIRWEER